MEKKEEKVDKKPEYLLTQADFDKKKGGNWNSNNNNPQGGRNYLPLAILGGIYLFFALKPKDTKEVFMTYKVEI